MAEPPDQRPQDDEGSTPPCPFKVSRFATWRSVSEPARGRLGALASRVSPADGGQHDGFPSFDGGMLRHLTSPVSAITHALSFDDDELDEAFTLQRERRINAAKLADSELWDLASPTAQGPMQAALHVLGETFLLARLTLVLWSYLGLGWRWFQHFVQLVVYAWLLMPGFAQMVLFYFYSRRVLRSIPYGPRPRNRLDLYLPRDHWRQAEEGLKPVVIFVTGGAWTIGYKAWGSLLGRRLSKAGCLVACLDYRNFPQGTVTEMLEDVNTGISWVLRRIQFFGGDPSRVLLVGQSCGAQLASLAVILQAEQLALNRQLPGGSPAWRPSALRGFVGVSGLYNVCDIADYLNSRGLYRPLFEKIQSLRGVPGCLKLLSPSYCVSDLGPEFVRHLPGMTLLHGSRDRCVPVKYAEQFRDALATTGAKVALRTYPEGTHTSPLIEGPLRGGRDELEEDILALVMGKRVEQRHYAMCPSLLIDMAALVNPF